MKNYFLILFAFLVCSMPAMAQENPAVPGPTYATPEPARPKSDWTKKFFTGGSLGLQFGSYTNIGVFPLLGYRFTPRLSAGLSGTYIYLNDKPNRFTTSLYGGSIFAEYNVYRGLAPHLEYEILNREIFDPYLLHRRRINVDSFLAGVSYTQEIGDNAGLYVMLLYNLIEDIYSPYENPVIRIGFNVGL